MQKLSSQCKSYLSESDSSSLLNFFNDYSPNLMKRMANLALCANTVLHLCLTSSFECNVADWLPDLVRIYYTYEAHQRRDLNVSLLSRPSAQALQSTSSGYLLGIYFRDPRTHRGQRRAWPHVYIFRSMMGASFTFRTHWKLGLVCFFHYKQFLQQRIVRDNHTHVFPSGSFVPRCLEDDFPISIMWVLQDRMSSWEFSQPGLMSLLLTKQCGETSSKSVSDRSSRIVHIICWSRICLFPVAHFPTRNEVRQTNFIDLAFHCLISFLLLRERAPHLACYPSEHCSTGNPTENSSPAA